MKNPAFTNRTVYPTIENPYEKMLKSILSQRKLIVRNGVSSKNTLLCLDIIKKLEIQMDAYGAKWDLDGWKKFLQRNHEQISFLIPSNVSGKTILEKLNKLIEE